MLTCWFHAAILSSALPRGTFCRKPNHDKPRSSAVLQCNYLYICTYLFCIAVVWNNFQTNFDGIFSAVDAVAWNMSWWNQMTSTAQHFATQLPFRSPKPQSFTSAPWYKKTSKNEPKPPPQQETKSSQTACSDGPNSGSEKTSQKRLPSIGHETVKT